MVRELLVGVGFLILLISGVGVHYILHSNSDVKALESISALTSITSPSFSRAFYEPRFESDAIHPSYPSMATINQRGFIYE